jgi:hypothetical protein
MRGKEDHNVPAFMEAAALLEATGWDVFNPASEVEAPGVDPTAPIEDTIKAITPEVCRFYARRDAHQIIEVMRAENGDCIFMLEDWSDSAGAKAEYHLAGWVGLGQVFFPAYKEYVEKLQELDENLRDESDGACMGDELSGLEPEVGAGS